MTSEADRARVTELLGRAPLGPFTVAVRDGSGDPVVICSHPLLDDGTPMPTTHWLVGPALRRAVDRLEAAGGVRAAAAEVDPVALAAAHTAYAAARDALLPQAWAGPRPTGGVGGTRRGVKCLHAHYAWYLAGGPDPVGAWVAARLGDPPPGGPFAVDADHEGPARRGHSPSAAAVSAEDPASTGAAMRPAGRARPGAVAAIDCGTNSTRLLVAGPDGEPLERLMRITRLGEGVDRTGALAPAAIERTMAVLEEYRRVMDAHGVERVRMTATSAARDAGNRDTFFAAAEAAVGARPELLGGDEEGCLSFAGATASLDPASGPWLVADIGGGSTELAVGGQAGGRPEGVRSLDVGCVRVTERFFAADPPTASEVAAARRHVGSLLDAAAGALPGFRRARTLVGLAGTVAALAAIEQRLTAYDRARVHHHVLRRATVEELLAVLSAEPAAARRLRPGVEEARADVIVGGAVVLAEVLRVAGAEACLTSEADILDGLVATLLVG